MVQFATVSGTGEATPESRQAQRLAVEDRSREAGPRRGPQERAVDALATQLQTPISRLEFKDLKDKLVRVREGWLSLVSSPVKKKPEQRVPVEDKLEERPPEEPIRAVRLEDRLAAVAACSAWERKQKVVGRK